MHRSQYSKSVFESVRVSPIQPTSLDSKRRQLMKEVTDIQAEIKNWNETHRDHNQREMQCYRILLEERLGRAKKSLGDFTKECHAILKKFAVAIDQMSEQARVAKLLEPCEPIKLTLKQE